MAYGKNDNYKTSLYPAVPIRLRCKVGGEWKPLDSFSNSQRQLIQRQIDRGSRIDAANPGITCREHSAASRTEIRCELCYLIKPSEAFSSRSKRDGENVCKRCSAWGETQEPEVTPAALETGHISIEEASSEVWQQKYAQSDDLFPDDAMPQAPITELSSLGLEDYEALSQAISGLSSDGGSGTKEPNILSTLSLPRSFPRLCPATASGSRSGSVAQSSRQSDAGSLASVPPHLKEYLSQDTLPEEPTSNNSRACPVRDLWDVETAGTSDSEAVPLSASTIPPHLRSRISADASSTARGSGDLFPKRGPGSFSTATTLRQEREGKKASKHISFNAWGPNGEQHTGIKCSTEPSSTDGDSATSTVGPHNSNDENAWQVVTAKGAKQPRGRDKWSKAPRLPRSELCKPLSFSHVTSRHFDPDTDEQQRMYYCQSEDSNF